MIDPVLQSRFTQAERLFVKARKAFAPLLEQMACAELLQHYPDAVTLDVEGWDDVDGALLRIRAVHLADGTVLTASIESEWENWEAMCENVEPHLDDMLMLNGKWYGESEIDVLRVLGVSA